MNVLELLERAFVLVCTPETWTYGSMAKDKQGHSISPVSENAVCFCSVGALQRVLYDEGLNTRSLVYTSAVDLLASMPLARKQKNVDNDIIRLNDNNAAFKVFLANDSSKHYEILSWWREAIGTARVTDEAIDALFV